MQKRNCLHLFHLKKILFNILSNLFVKGTVSRDVRPSVISLINPIWVTDLWIQLF
jgi:hypothetical protein